VDLTYSAEDQAFRAEVRDWLEDNLAGEFAGLRGKGGPGREHEAFEERVAWDRHLAAAGWTCLGWPVEHGGRGLPLLRQVIFHEEYAKAGAPARVSHIGEELLGPTLLAFGTEEQQKRFLPGIRSVEELWCQGYSEPGAGSDLASVSTKARLVSTGSTTRGSTGSTTRGSTGSTTRGSTGSTGSTSEQEWVVDGQKVWTSLAHVADWCFVLARTEPGSTRHHGLSYLLVPMRQQGVEVRPIEQLTGGSEFNEVFFSGARTAADLVVGEPGDGWRVAMGTLGFERGVSTVGQQVGFARELQGVVALARENGSIDDPVVRERLVRARMGLEVMRLHALRTLAGHQTGSSGPEASVAKLVWASWHRSLGELAMLVAGPASLTAGSGSSYDLDEWQRLFLFSRADTIYGGSDEVQRNIISERVLGLPREVRP
jgi:alkylation response protein AidB-like acyl-CoA dehydrogenase